MRLRNMFNWSCSYFSFFLRAQPNVVARTRWSGEKKKKSIFVVHLARTSLGIFWELINVVLHNSHHSPITSARLLVDENQASSPNLPIWYLERKSFGNPQTTEMKCGLARSDEGSRKVENLFFISRDKARIVIIEDCIVGVDHSTRSCLKAFLLLVSVRTRWKYFIDFCFSFSTFFTKFLLSELRTSRF